MKTNHLLALSLAVSNIATVCLTTAATSQGMMEMGNLYGASPRGGAGGLGDAIKNIYGRGTTAPPVSKGSPASQMDPEDLSRFAAQANKSYLAGSAAQKAGKANIAIKEYGTAILIRERVWGVGDPAIAELARRQAELHKKAGRLADAENAYRKVLTSETRRFGPGAPEVTKTVASLAAVCEQQDKPKDASSFYRQLYALKLKAGGPGASDTKPLCLKIAKLLSATQDYAGAKQLLTDAITAEESSGNPDNAYLTQLYDCCSTVLHSTGQDTEAAAIESKSQTIKAAAAKRPADSELPPVPSAAPATPAPNADGAAPPTTSTK